MSGVCPSLSSHRALCPPSSQQPEQHSSLLSDLHIPGAADHNPSSRGRLTHLPRGSGYKLGLTETHSKPCI